MKHKFRTLFPYLAMTAFALINILVMCMPYFSINLNGVNGFLVMSLWEGVAGGIAAFFQILILLCILFLFTLGLIGILGYFDFIDFDPGRINAFKWVLITLSACLIMNLLMSLFLTIFCFNNSGEGWRVWPNVGIFLSLFINILCIIIFVLFYKRLNTVREQRLQDQSQQDDHSHSI